MRLLNSVQVNEVAGGTLLNVDGTYLYVNSYGIPQHCADQFGNMYNDLFKAFTNPFSTAESTLGTLGAQMDRIEQSNCLPYLDLFNQRMDSAIWL